jgi:hypothetical protein
MLMVTAAQQHHLVKMDLLLEVLQAVWPKR